MSTEPRSLLRAKPLSDDVCAGSGRQVSKPVGEQYPLVDCPACPRSFEPRSKVSADTARVPRHRAPTA